MISFILSLAEKTEQEKIQYLYDTFHKDLMRFAKYRLKNAGMPNYATDAEDAVQNAFVKIAKYGKAIDLQEDLKKIKAYLFTVVRNEVANIVKEYTYFDDIDEMPNVLPEEDFFEKLQIRERYEQVVNVIKELDEKYSITLYYRYEKELSAEEIAELMGLSVKTVYTRLERGRRLVLEKLGDENV